MRCEDEMRTEWKNVSAVPGAISTVPALRVGISSPARNSGIEMRNLVKPFKADLMPFSEFLYLHFL
jgi:hypothetical protein